MKTIEQIAALAAVKCYEVLPANNMLDQFKAIIAAAIHEAAAPQVDWENAVAWPTEPGLWCHLLGEVCEWIFTDNELTAWNLTGEMRDEHRCGKFYGPMTPSLPAPPKPPSPWDYKPKDGDFIWVKYGESIDCAPYLVHDWNGNLKIPGRDLTIAEMRSRGWKFCKAEVSPAPPEAP